MAETDATAQSTNGNGNGRKPGFILDKCISDVQTLQKLVKQEHWTIEYYEHMPGITILRPPGDKIDEKDEHGPGEHDYSRLETSTGKTQIWGCRLCHRFYNYPSLLFDDLLRNHHLRPDAARCGQYVIKLEVVNRDLFKILNNDKSNK